MKKGFIKMDEIKKKIDKLFLLLMDAGVKVTKRKLSSAFKSGFKKDEELKKTISKVLADNKLKKEQAEKEFEKKIKQQNKDIKLKEKEEKKKEKKKPVEKNKAPKIKVFVEKKQKEVEKTEVTSYTNLTEIDIPIKKASMAFYQPNDKVWNINVSTDDVNIDFNTTQTVKEALRNAKRIKIKVQIIK